MTTKVLIAHASGEEAQAEKLAKPIRKAGYEVVHEGTVVVGDSVVTEAGKLLAEGCPVVLCATVRAMGTKWARQVANAARKHVGVRLFVVQMEADADTDTVSFDEVIARPWQDAAKAAADLVAALRKHYPPEGGGQRALRAHDLEARYRELALKACDIIDLANLPEDDRHPASRELELRRLYVALRMRLEVQAGDAVDDETLAVLDGKLLFEHFNENFQVLDPLATITTDRIASAAKRLKLSSNEVRQHYERFAERFGLTVEPVEPPKRRSGVRKAKPTTTK